MVEPITTEIDFILSHRIEHDSVIGIGGMTQGKDFSAVLPTAVHEVFAPHANLYAVQRGNGIKIG
jgi:hypothetical protein